MKYNTENLHKILGLLPALEFHLRQAEIIRKEISQLSLRTKRKTKKVK